jgi:proteasome lid subunit RPN8/RPN11
MTSTSTFSDQADPAQDPSPAAKSPAAKSPAAKSPAATPQEEPEQALKGTLRPAAPSPETGSTATPSTIRHGSEPGLSQVRVAMTQLSLRQIEGHAIRDLSRELGGVLLGEKGRDDEGYYVKVRATLPVRTADHGPAHFTFTADAWAQLHQERSQRYPDLDIVGWYHTHPNLGVFYSADDVVVHTAAFVMPWQVGLVYDPVRGEGCLAGWRQPGGHDSEPVLAEIDGYYEILDEQIGSVVTWQFLRSSVWHEGAYPMEARPRPGQVYAPPNAWPALPPISPWWGVILGGLSLLLTLILLIDRLLASAG